MAKLKEGQKVTFEIEGAAVITPKAGFYGVIRDEKEKILKNKELISRKENYK